MKNQSNLPAFHFLNLKKDSIVFMATLFLLLPFFFFYFRIMAFGTVPVDDYDSFILSMDGKLENFQFYSPQGYRWFYFGFGFALYKTLPLIELTKFDTSDMPKLLALQSLAVVSFIFSHLILFANYCIVRCRLGKSIGFSLAVSLLVFLISLQTNIYTIDAVSLGWISIMLLFIGNFRMFTSLLLLSIFINEKIPLLFFVYFLLMLVFDRRKAGLSQRFAVSFLAVCIYFGERAMLQFPGFEYQTQPQLFFERMALSIPHLLSVKGLYMNILPLALLSGIAVLCSRLQIFETSFYKSKAIAGLPLLFFILGMFACSNFGIGRISMHSLPFFTIPIAMLLERFEKSPGSPINSEEG